MIDDEELDAQQAAWEQYWASLSPEDRRLELLMMDEHEADPHRRDEHGRLI